MFSLVNGIYQAYFSTPQLNILVVGAQASGKTTLMERIKVTEFAAKASTKGSGVLTQYSSALSAAEARAVFYSDGSVQVDEQDHAEPPASPVPATTNQNDDRDLERVVLETPETKRRLAAISMNQQRRFRWICPAPKTYQHDEEESDDSDDDESDDDDDDGVLDNGHPELNQSLSDIPLPLDMHRESASLLPVPKPREQQHYSASNSSASTPRQSSRNFLPVASSPFRRGSDPPADIPAQSPSMKDQNDERMAAASMLNIDMSDHDDEKAVRYSERNGNGSRIHETLQQSQQQQLDYNLKKNCKMLPLIKIRPTIGMNLCRINNICGAKCHIMDVGGRMQQLWERYYHDCDAVIFVWKLDSDVEDDDSRQQEDDSDSDDDRPAITAKQQLEMLQRVRSSIPEDVPFLMLGQGRTLTLPANVKTDRMYSSSCLLPNYHNLYQALYFANAATGQGVKSATEWLVSLAKRQQITRGRASVNAKKS